MPVLIVVVPTLPGRLLGLSMGPIVVLEDSVAQDLGTLEHELVHTKQFWRNGLVLHFLRYWMSRNYRLAMELEAFRGIESSRGGRLRRTLRVGRAVSLNLLRPGY